MEHKIGDIVSVPLYIGTAHNKPIYRHARILEIYPKGHLGVMYLCEVLPAHFKTCIVVPPPPRFQPDPRDDKDIQRWTKATHHNSLEVEPTANPKRNYLPKAEKQLLEERYTPMLERLGLDLSKKRSIKQLRSIAHYRGFPINVIEKGEYKWD